MSTLELQELHGSQGALGSRGSGGPHVPQAPQVQPAPDRSPASPGPRAQAAASAARARPPRQAALRAALVAACWVPLRRTWTNLTQTLDAKPERERAAFGALALAVLVALEFLWVLPMRAQRQAVLSAAQAQLEAEQAAALEQQQQQANARAEAEARLVVLERELRAHGVGASQGETLAAWLQRALADQSVTLVSLRDLGTQEAEPPAASPAVPGAGPAAEAAAAMAAPADTATPAPGTGAPEAAVPTRAMLYRHRYELTLAGDAAALTAAVQALGERLLPLRLAQVRIASGDGVKVQATLAFVVVSPQRVWISL